MVFVGAWQALVPSKPEAGRPEEADKKLAEGRSTAAPGVDPAANVAGLKDDLEELRGDLRRTGTALGTIVTAVVTAIGYTQLHDIFPFPAGASWWLKLVAVLAATAGLLASALLVFRFYAAQRRILIGRDLKGEGQSKKELELAERVTAIHAQSEGMRRFTAVSLRASRLERIARRLAESDIERSKVVHAEATRLRDFEELALRRTALSIMERRARKAFGGVLATILILLAVGGAGFTFAIADYAKGQRSLAEEDVRRATACLDHLSKPSAGTSTVHVRLTEGCIARLAKAPGETGAAATTRSTSTATSATTYTTASSTTTRTTSATTSGTTTNTTTTSSG